MDERIDGNQRSDAAAEMNDMIIMMGLPHALTCSQLI